MRFQVGNSSLAGPTLGVCSTFGGIKCDLDEVIGLPGLFALAASKTKNGHQASACAGQIIKCKAVCIS